MKYKIKKILEVYYKTQSENTNKAIIKQTTLNFAEDIHQLFKEAMEECINEIEENRATYISFWLTKHEGIARITDTDELVLDRDEIVEIWNDAIDKSIKVLKSKLNKQGRG
jgi:hypothetical protein